MLIFSIYFAFLIFIYLSSFIFEKEKLYSKKIEENFSLYIFPKKSSGLLYILIKKIILADLNIFKYTDRTHLLLVRSIFITLNITIIVLITFLLLDKILPFAPINLECFKVSSQDEYHNKTSFILQIASALITILSALYWNLRNDQNKKFEYCLNLYNNIYLHKDSNPKLKVTLAMDLLTMDLWMKRIFKPYFDKVIMEASEYCDKKIEGFCYHKDDEGIIIDTEYAFNLLEIYAGEEREKSSMEKPS